MTRARDGSGHPAELTKWQLLLLDTAREEYPARVAEALAEPGLYSSTENIPRLVNLLEGALTVHQEVNTRDLGELVALSFEVVLTTGVGSSFRGLEQFRDNALDLIDVLRTRGAPISGHLLAAARFQALLANGDESRRTLIEQAVDSSSTDEHRLEALLTLSRYLVDVSKYRASRRVLAECQVLLRNPALSRWSVEYEWSLGLSHFYGSPERANNHFKRAVHVGRSMSEDPRVHQAMASSLHYLGRLAAQRGQISQALRLFVEAEQLSDDYLIGHGFYHQRMAEVLVDHGSLAETYYHLAQAQKAFAQVAHRSNGFTLLDGVRSRYYQRTGELTQVEKILASALEKSRQERGPRVELMLLVEQFRLQVRQRHRIRAGRTVMRAGLLYVRSESVRAPWNAARQLVTAATQLARMTRSRSSAVRPVTCPCGAQH